MQWSGPIAFEPHPWTARGALGKKPEADTYKCTCSPHSDVIHERDTSTALYLA